MLSKYIGGGVSLPLTSLLPSAPRYSTTRSFRASRANGIAKLIAQLARGRERLAVFSAVDRAARLGCLGRRERLRSQAIADFASGPAAGRPFLALRFANPPAA